MKINVGDRYNLSEKLKKAFEINDNICKIISISNNIVTLQINSEMYTIKTETALENLSLSYTPKADLSEDSSKRKRKKKEDNDKIDNVVESKPIPIIKDEEISVPPSAIFPELPPAPAPKPVVQPVEPIKPEVKSIEPEAKPIIEPVKPEVKPIIEPVKPEVKPEIITIIPENNNIIQPSVQDNDESENPDEGFF